jgi:hypothetical protein
VRRALPSDGWVAQRVLRCRRPRVKSARIKTRVQ